MVWALLILFAVIVGVHWWEYRNSIKEYTFAQPSTLDRTTELRGLLAEKTPIAVEIEILPWRPEIATKAPWTAQINQDSGNTSSTIEVSVGTWMTDYRSAPLLNQTTLSEQIGLSTGLGDIDAARGWWWLPGIYDTSVDILKGNAVVGLSWVTAERQWIGCSHGGPLTIWLVHSRYRPFLPTQPTEPVDPWALSAKEAPWIGRVQYIEVMVKQGWCLGIPAHWGFAIRSSESDSWWWTGSQHSTLSWALTHYSDVQLSSEEEDSESEESHGGPEKSLDNPEHIPPSNSVPVS
jgi:hypothetical protein